MTTESVAFFIMGKRIEYLKGQKIDNCFPLEEAAEAVITDLKNGFTNSFGCYRPRNGTRSHPLYNRWHAMMSRCHNQNNKRYKDYGGRGITVCDEWIDNPQLYFDYIASLPNAMKPGLTIDRIRNNEGYKPGNLRWATAKEQTDNRRKRSAG